MGATVYGMLPDDTPGRYLLAAARRVDGSWSIARVKPWRATLLRGELLLGRGIMMGIRTHWGSGPLRPGELGVETAPGGGVSMRAFDSERVVHCDALRRNVLGVVSEDIGLATLPLHLGGAPDTFLSVLPRPDCYAVGAVVGRQLRLVVHMPRGDEAALNGQLGRVRRYLTRYAAKLPEPMPVYLLDMSLPQPQEEFCFTVVRTGGGSNALSVAQAQAAGVALASLEPESSRLAGATPHSAFRAARVALYGAAAAAVLLCALGMGYIGVRARRASRHLSVRRAEYEQALSSSSEARRLLEINRVIAERIVRIRNTYAFQTRWSELLGLLAEKRTAAITIDVLGSEPIGGDPTRMRVALGGIAAKETDATGFIAMLQQVPYVSAISLHTLERDRDGANTRFRIICTFQLFDS